MGKPFEYIGALQCENRILRKKVADYESGERFQQIQMEHQKVLDEYRRQIKRLKQTIENLRKDVRKAWKWCEEAYEDALKELNAQMKDLEHALKKAKRMRFAAEQRRDQALSEVAELRRENSELKDQLEKTEGQNKKLLAQLNRDYENSSIPSSQSRNRRKISNNRERTGRKPGAQPGHAHHGRKKQEATQTVHLPAPKIVAEDPDFKKTKKIITKQLVSIEMILHVTEYQADVYRNSKTGEKVHAAFPAGVVDDVNYDGSIKSLLFLLNTDCAVSIDKSQRFLSDLTGGKLKISRGMINKLCREFSSKTETERKKIFADLLSCPVLHTDCTNARENGKNCQVYVCVTPDGKALYFAREKKGHEGVKGTVTEDYQGILVHDHDLTFYHYGANHQECLAHVLRYLKDSIDNEPERTWNKEMRSLVQEMIHFRKGFQPTQEPDLKKVSEFEKRYQKILETARKEYRDIPANDHYRDGYNLFLRMEKYMQNHLLFLHNSRVPATNNEAERLLRNYKRKQAQAVTFRSFESIDYLCQCMSMLVLMRLEESANIFDRVSKIFG